MRHFHRTSAPPDRAITLADEWFGALGLACVHREPRRRRFTGALGTLDLVVRMEGGHYTFVEVATDQVGESRLDKNVRKYFVQLHRTVDPAHAMEAGY
jgi:hypothetical protein